MTSASPAPTRRLSAENRREQILETAETLFIERGFEGVGMNDIAQALGTSRPTIYTYFTSTEAMLRALLDARLPHLWERLNPLLTDLGKFQPGFYRRVFHALLQERELLLLMHSGGGPTFREERTRLLAQLGELIEPYRPQDAPRSGCGLHLLTLLLESVAVDALRSTDTDIETLADTLGLFIAGGVNALRAEG